MLSTLLMRKKVYAWNVSDNEQRLDPFNGLLLQPNLDKLFDRGYITFDMQGNITCSRLLEKGDRKSLGIDNNMHLLKFDDNLKKYLEYHQENCFIG